MSPLFRILAMILGVLFFLGALLKLLFLLTGSEYPVGDLIEVVSFSCAGGYFTYGYYRSKVNGKLGTKEK